MSKKIVMFRVCLQRASILLLSKIRKIFHTGRSSPPLRHLPTNLCIINFQMIINASTNTNLQVISA